MPGPGSSLFLSRSYRQTAWCATLRRALPLPGQPPTLCSPHWIGSRPCPLWQMGACPVSGLRDMLQQDWLRVHPSPCHPLAGGVSDPGTVCCRAGSVGACSSRWIPQGVPGPSTGSPGTELGTGGGQRRECNRSQLKLGVGRGCLALPTEAPTACSPSAPRLSGSPRVLHPLPHLAHGEAGARDLRLEPRHLCQESTAKSNPVLRVYKDPKDLLPPVQASQTPHR